MPMEGLWVSLSQGRLQSRERAAHREEFKAKSGRLLLECEIWDLWRGAVVRIVKGGGRLGWGEN